MWPSLVEKYDITGAVVATSDVYRGIGISAGLEAVDPDRLADGDLRTKAAVLAASRALRAEVSGRGVRVMTIDIHTVRDGKLAVAHHVEDWATALRQLAGKQ